MKDKLILAVIKNRNNRVVGYRFLDINGLYVEDYALNSQAFVSFLKKNKDNMENGQWKVGHSGSKQLLFTNGTEKRYPVLDSETLEVVGGRNPLVVVAELRDGYVVSSPYGEIMEWYKEQTFDYARMNGIANGKCSSSVSGSRFISSINDNYPFIDRKIAYPEEKARERAIKEAKKKKLVEQMEREQREAVKKTVVVKANEGASLLAKEAEFKDTLAKKFIEKEKENAQDTASLDAQFSKEINRVLLTEAEETSAVKEAKEYDAVRESTQTYDNDFYKQLEPTFGGRDSVALLKYAIEVRHSMTREEVLYYVAEGTEDNKYVPTLLTLLMLEVDKIFAYKSDEAEFRNLCKKAIDPAVLSLVGRLIEQGIPLADVWDVPIYKESVVAENKLSGGKYALPLAVLENRLAYYAVNNSVLGCKIEDGAVYYGSHVVDVPGYKLCGIGLDYITITDGDKIKKIRLSK